MCCSNEHSTNAESSNFNWFRDGNKKLRLCENKCFKIHVCKTDTNYTQVLKFNENKMKSATHGTYLGDVISEMGTIDETVLQRTEKATGITSQFN